MFQNSSYKSSMVLNKRTGMGIRMENYVYIDMEKYKRLSHFNYFKSLANPYVGITADVDITRFYETIKKKNYPFFLPFLWCVSRAANGVREFRQRIIDDRIIEYDFCITSHTVAKEDGTYSYCQLDECMELEQFLEYAAIEQNKAKLLDSIDEDLTEYLSYLFVSSIPWVTYTSVINPTPFPADSNPRINWGKYVKRDNRIYMPVSVLCNHALVDGRQLGEFYRLLEEEIAGI